MTEKEKMLAGELYDAGCGELAALRKKAHSLCAKYNLTSEDETEKRAALLSEILGAEPDVYFQGPVQFDYGVFSEFGEGCYANFNFTVLDCCPVKVGKNVLFGPNCTLATPIHPMIAEERNGKVGDDGSFHAYEYAKPIVIEDSCWLASNVTVCGGVTIGSGCVIGAGSVVTRNIPAGWFAAGNPCRPIRKITEADSVFKNK